MSQVSESEDLRTRSQKQRDSLHEFPFQEFYQVLTKTTKKNISEFTEEKQVISKTPEHCVLSNACLSTA